MHRAAFLTHEICRREKHPAVMKNTLGPYLGITGLTNTDSGLKNTTVVKNTRTVPENNRTVVKNTPVPV